MKQQGFRAELKSRLHGEIAVIVAISLAVLIVMHGVALDLSRFYVTKTGLLATGVFW